MVDIYDPVQPLPLNKLDFRQMILQGPNTPILSLYPRTLQGHKLRSFQKEWYQKYEWLEYSSAIDAVFCFPCRCFRGNEKNSTHYDAAFSKTGFRAWYRANEAFKKHQYSKNHTNSSTALSNYLKLKSIDCQLDIARQAAISKKEEERLENRKFMYRVIDIVICLVKSGRPLRGHDESETSTNQGLFRELLNLLSKYDNFLQSYYEHNARNALYRSNRIQNDIIKSIYNVVLKKIKSNMETSHISIIADETSDVGHSEQLSIVIRYFDGEKNRPIETLVALKRMTSVTAQSIFDSLDSVIRQMGKDWTSVLAVWFDGASTMSGSLGGVQAKCKEQNADIKYVHCYAHCLNLVLVDAVCEKSISKQVKKNRLVFNFFGTIQFIYNFIESSPIRHATLEKIAKETNVTLMTIKSCSTTRWACRAEAVKAILNNYDTLLLTIDEICNNCSVPEMRAKGIGLLYQMKTFEFVFGMFMMYPILNLILKVSSLLQTPKLNLLLALDNVQSLTSNLKSFRNKNKEFEDIFNQAEALCKKHQIIIPDLLRRKVSTQIDQKSNSQYFFKNKKDEMKISVYYQLLDDLISAMNSRFNQETLNLIKAVASLLQMETKPEMIDILAKFSNTSSTDLITEINLLKHLPKSDLPDGILSESIYL